MKPLVLNLLHALWTDEMAVRRWLRAAFVGFGLCGVAFAQSLAEVIEAPGAVKWIRVASVVCGGVGAMISVGQKNQSLDAIAEALQAKGPKPGGT